MLTQHVPQSAEKLAPVLSFDQIHTCETAKLERIQVLELGGSLPGLIGMGRFVTLDNMLLMVVLVRRHNSLRFFYRADYLDMRNNDVPLDGEALERDPIGAVHEGHEIAKELAGHVLHGRERGAQLHCHLTHDLYEVVRSPGPIEEHVAQMYRSINFPRYYRAHTSST